MTSGERRRKAIFGKDPKIWGEEEYDSLIELLAIGLRSSAEEWMGLRYHPTAWSSSGTETGHKAANAHIKALEALADVVCPSRPQ